MIIHEFINNKKPVMVLIHGVLTPWQIWKPQIEFFKNSYTVYVVSLNTHNEEKASEFISVKAEAEQIVMLLIKKGVQTIDALCGISLGGKIAYEICKSGKIEISNLIMDGAPLVKCLKFAVNIMINNYKNIIHKSKKRDAKIIENFKKYFLPEKYLESYLKIADLMTDNSIENMVSSVFSESEIKASNNRGRLLFIHGTKGNEILSRKSARKIKESYPDAEIICFRGDAHCYKAIHQPEKWIKVVNDFLRRV